MKAVNRRQFSAIALLGAVGSFLGFAKRAEASPNGTRPTKLVDLAVVSVNATQMRVSGRLLLLDNQPLAGLAVQVYAVGTSYFTRWATAYTDNAGRFTVTASKVASGQQVQIEVEGNGAYSRPLPTFARA